MKSKFFSIAAIAVFTLFGCKNENNHQVTVIKDCTGSYLRFEGKDYHVCNREKLAAYPDGTVATATFKRLKECNGTAKDDIVCALYHQNEGWIAVSSIK